MNHRPNSPQFGLAAALKTMVVIGVVSAYVHYVAPMRLLLAAILGLLSVPVLLFPLAALLIVLGESHPRPTVFDFALLTLIATTFWILCIPDW